MVFSGLTINELSGCVGLVTAPGRQLASAFTFTIYTLSITSSLRALHLYMFVYWWACVCAGLCVSLCAAMTVSMMLPPRRTNRSRSLRGQHTVAPSWAFRSTGWIYGMLCCRRRRKKRHSLSTSSQSKLFHSLEKLQCEPAVVYRRRVLTSPRKPSHTPSSLQNLRDEPIHPVVDTNVCGIKLTAHNLNRLRPGHCIDGEVIDGMTSP